MKPLCMALVLFLHAVCSGQSRPGHLLVPAEGFNAPRFWGVTGGVTVGTGLSLVLLNQYWYADYPRSGFHFFDDSQEWLQIDKVSHAFTAYTLSAWSSELWSWTGMRADSRVVGALTGFGLMLTVEVLDGFSEKWGASWSDLGANLFGSGLYLGQELLFRDQPAMMKVSAFPRRYNHVEPAIRERAAELFGTSLPERTIKDYNATTVWLSYNFSWMLPKHEDGTRKFPNWFAIALGYGAHNLFGGFKNCWCDDPLVSPENCPPADLIDYSHVPRYQQWYLAPDIDLGKIRSRHRGLQLLVHALNIFKFPTPALEYNRVDGLRFHWLYF
jgi:hypothetical protein